MIGVPGRGSRDHVLMPIAATANGRLHLGHIGGPMLKMDVLARHLRRLGDRVALVGSTDPYDSFILIRARENEQTPTEVVGHWHPLIEHDLRSAGIEPDSFMNFLDEPWRTRNHETCDRIVRDLTAQDLVFERTERFPYCEAAGDFVIGGFLRGRCPDCAAPTAGYFCEECGLLFRPEQVSAAECGYDGCTPTWRTIPCLYARLPDPEAVEQRIAALGVTEPFRRIVHTYLQRQGAELRLTQPGTWGVPVPVPGSPVPQVAFTYVVCGLAFLTLTAEIGAELLGSPPEPPRTLVSFGYDNALPFLLGGLGLAMALPGYRPTEHMLLNHFMTLDGSKFSTSRGHVIWTGELAAETGADAIRAYLMNHSPDHAQTDFSRAGFEDYRDKVLRGTWRAAVEQANSALAELPSALAELPSALADRLNELLAVQDRALDPATFDLARVPEAVQAWIDDGPSADAPAWWLRGLALLSWPVTPTFAGTLWTELGLPGEPDATRFQDTPTGKEDLTCAMP